MEAMINYIEKKTGETNLRNKSWKEIVDTVVLPKMAGPKGTRWCINDLFMNFVADFAYEIESKGNYIASALLEIGLQRLSCGAVKHEATPWPEPLPEEYWSYSSKWDEAHVMTEGCYNFIMKAMKSCLRNKVTRSHARAILFGLMKQLSPNGETPRDSYYSLAMSDVCTKSRFSALYCQAERLVEAYTSEEELYAHYAQPEQWQKHKRWFAENVQMLNWKKFFADTKCTEGNFIRRWRQRRAIKKELRLMLLPVAR